MKSSSIDSNAVAGAAGGGSSGRPCKRQPRQRATASWLLSLAVLATAAGCGGGSSEATTAGPQTAPAVVNAERAVAAVAVDAAAGSAPEPLFTSSGEPSAAARQAMPVDPGARTRGGLYASAAQYAWEAQHNSAYTTLIDLDANAALATDDADGTADAMPAEPPAGAPASSMAHFVRASDLTAGARFANRLAARGALVFLVVGEQR